MSLWDYVINSGPRSLIYHVASKTLTESYIPNGINKKNVTLPKGTTIYNVRNSTGDIVTYGGQSYRNMISLWESLTGKIANRCCVCGDKDNIVGGHVVTDEDMVYPARNDIVYIVPLCSSCNNYHNRDAMVLRENTPALVLYWDK